MKWSGNFYYQVRLSERRKGYATKMLEIGLNELKKIGFDIVYGQSSAGNIGSAKTIENNNGIFIKENEGTRYYKILLQKVKIMVNVFLKVPRKDQLFYRQDWMNDPETMEYNAGYDMELKGYERQSGTISKTDEEMLEWYDK